MNTELEAGCRRLGVAAAAVLLVLWVAVAAPSGGVLAPMTGPVAAALAEAQPSARPPCVCVHVPSGVEGAVRAASPSRPPRQRDVLTWGLPPPRAPTA